MIYDEQAIPLSDCPNCGKKNSAAVGSNSWGHPVFCCSEECGRAIGEKIKTNMESYEYRSAVEGYFALKGRIMELKYEGTGVKDAPLGDSISRVPIRLDFDYPPDAVVSSTDT